MKKIKATSVKAIKMFEKLEQQIKDEQKTINTLIKILKIERKREGK